MLSPVLLRLNLGPLAYDMSLYSDTPNDHITIKCLFNLSQTPIRIQY